MKINLNRDREMIVYFCLIFILFFCRVFVTYNYANFFELLLPLFRERVFVRGFERLLLLLVNGICEGNLLWILIGMIF